jgi:hypothetical protein
LVIADNLTSLLYMYVDAIPKRPEAVPETRILERAPKLRRWPLCIGA